MTQLERIRIAFSNVANSVNDHGIKTPKSIYYFSDHIKLKAKEVEERVLDQIAVSYESYNDIISAPIAPDELPGETNKKHLRSFLHKFGLKIDENAYDFISDEFLVEVYSKNHQQMFRSINFFSLSQYTLPELTFIPWNELFHRPESSFKTMMNFIEYVFDNKIGLLTPTVPVHILTELKTGRKFRYEMVKLCCVFDEFLNCPLGYLTLISVQELKGDLTLLQ